MFGGEVGLFVEGYLFGVVTMFVVPHYYYFVVTGGDNFVVNMI